MLGIMDAGNIAKFRMCNSAVRVTWKATTGFGMKWLGLWIKQLVFDGIVIKMFFWPVGDM